MNAVIYAAKSTEDRHGSIPTQLTDCRALAEREDWNVVGEYHDEGFSAYHGNRGAGLARAKEVAAANAPCVIVVQDLDRLARGAGDAPGAADHLGELFFQMRRQRVGLWSARTGEVDSIRAVLEGERSHSESERKAQATAAGLKRRKDRGAPVGPVPFGRKVVQTVVEDRVITRRVLDPETAPHGREAYRLVAEGATPGEVARRFNAAKITTRRGNAWSQKTVRNFIANPANKGELGYEPLVEEALWNAANAALRRLDPVALQSRKGGRPPTAYVTKDLAFCGRCGAPMYRVTHKYGDRSAHLACKNKLESTGLCDAPPIPAATVERAVMAHFVRFVDDVDAWLSVRVHERSREQDQHEDQVAAARRDLADLDRKLRKAQESYEQILLKDGDLVPVALRQVARLEAAREDAARSVQDAEAIAAEWTAAPDLDAALGFVERLKGVFGEMLPAALLTANPSGAAIRRSAPFTLDPAAVNRALRAALSSIRLHVEDGQLHAEFALRVPEDPVGPRGPVPRQTAPLTHVNGDLYRAVPLPPLVVAMG